MNFQFDLNNPSIVEETEENAEENSPELNAEALSRNINLNGTPQFDLNIAPGFELQEQESNENERKRKMLSNDERRAIYMDLLEKSVNGKLKRNTTKEVSIKYVASIRTVQRIWKLAKDNPNDTFVDVSHKKTDNCGRKRVELNREQFRNIPFPQRSSLESLSSATNISKSTLFRNLKYGVIRRHSNSIKPYLKDENMKARVEFCLSMLDENNLPYDPQFLDMYNWVHIDEKWFYITKKNEHYYLLNDEDEPQRMCKSKNFLEKIMFLAVVARPRFDADGNEVFSGKIGIFPFITREPAKRSSVNRPAGTLETKAMTSMGKETVMSFLIEKVLPAICTKWPDNERGMPIIIQQDNARTHVNPDDVEFCKAVSESSFNIRLVCQPPNSPDLNVLDLGFFCAIQSLQHKVAAKTVYELVVAVQNAFDTYSSTKLNYIFLTQQQVIVKIMESRGSNKYKIPHINKTALDRDGRLPRQIKCEKKLIDDVHSWLNSSV